MELMFTCIPSADFSHATKTCGDEMRLITGGSMGELPARKFETHRGDTGADHTHSHV